MRGYRLTALGKVVVFSFIFLLILSTAYTVKAFIYHQGTGDNNPNVTSKTVPTNSNHQVNVLEKIHKPYANKLDTSLEIDISKIKNTKLTIYFEPDADIIRDQYYESLDMFANVADILKDFTIEVEGNCATVYTDVIDNKSNITSYNLSLARAKAVLYYLQGKAVNPNRIVIIGNGSNKPIKSNTTEVERQYNRRVEISFKLKKN